MGYEFAPVDAEPAWLFSRSRIPPSPLLKSITPGEHAWLSLDSAANYRKNPHPTLGADQVRYSINRQGYRAADLDRAAEDGRGRIRIVCVGSSGAFGIGLPEAQTFPAVFRELVQQHTGHPAMLWNLSHGGTGADYVTRMLFSALPVLRPHFVLMTCFPFNRREYIGETGRLFISHGVPHWQQRLSDPEHWHYDDAVRRVSNPYTDLVNIVTNMKVWESLCGEARVPWLFTTEAYAEQLAPIEGLLKESRCMVGPGIHALIDAHRKDPAEGLARDMLHAGARPNRLLAEAMFERALALYPQEMAALKELA